MRSLRARWSRVRLGCARTLLERARRECNAQGWSSLRRTFQRSGSRTTRTRPCDGSTQRCNMHRTACAHATGSDARRTACCEGGPGRHAARPSGGHAAVATDLAAGRVCTAAEPADNAPLGSPRQLVRVLRHAPHYKVVLDRAARRRRARRCTRALPRVGKRWTPCGARLPRSVRHAASRAPSAACCAAETVRWRTLLYASTLVGPQVPRHARWHR